MLAESITERQVTKYVTNDRWACEPKVDGHRCLIRMKGERVSFTTRQGLAFEHVPPAIRASFAAYAKQGVELIVDGELLPATGQLWLFDCMGAGSPARQFVSPTDPFDTRRATLENLVAAGFGDHPLIDVLPSYTNQIDKAKLILDIKARCAEGVIFRDRQAPYMEKRTDRLLKYKFRYTADCVVTAKGRDGKDNLVLGMFDENGRCVDVGTVSALTGDGPRVGVGQVVEVTYLYASADRKLTQPVTPMLRVDKAPDECTIDQLIYPDKTVQGI